MFSQRRAALGALVASVLSLGSAADAACCLDSGFCADVDSSFVCETILGGSFVGGPCSTANCPQPLQSCCAPGGGCLDIGQIACDIIHGQFQAVDCADADCAIACCLPDGSCVALSEDDCVAQSGTGFGDSNCFLFPCPPVNDDCADATPISGLGLFSFVNNNATSDGPDHGDCSPQDDVWFCWEAPCDGEVEISTCLLALEDTVLTVYDECACDDLPNSVIACSDDDCALIFSRVSFTATAGNRYLIRVGNDFGIADLFGHFKIQMECPTACCLPLGNCELLLPSACGAANGVVQPNVFSCDNADCPIPPDGAIECPPDVTVECGEPTEPMYTGMAMVSPNCDDPTYDDVVSNPTDQCPTVQVITRTWTAMCGSEEQSCVQTITVQDTTAPTIMCPMPVEVQCPGDIPMPDVNAVMCMDACDDTPTVMHTGDTPLDSPCGGMIVRMYECVDDCGNTSSCMQMITVNDTTAPEITCPPDVTIECGEDTDPCNTGEPTATDNCDAMLQISYADSMSGSCPDGKVIERTWTATDTCGNADSCVQIITIRTFAHPGWNHVSAEITLTKNEPAYWSAFSGQPKGVPPFTVLDPASAPSNIPGRPDPEGSGDWVLRGYVVGWAVNSSNEEIRWNHLKGDAILIDYDDPSAWEYTTWAFPVVADVANGEATGTPGVLNLDGVEYAPGFDQLVLDFYAPDSYPFDGAVVDTDLTLLPISVDLRQEDDGPVTTKAKIDIWNENEVKFNGTERCITCWDQTLLRNYTSAGVPNSFLYANLQTAKGKARIDGQQSNNCDFDFEFDPLIPFGADPRDIVSQDASLLGVAAKWITFVASAQEGVAGSSSEASPRNAAAGLNLIGMGSQAATIQYDPLGSTPESTESAVEDIIRELLQQRSARRAGDRHPIGSTEGVASTVDRVSGSEKGSLLIWSKVEIRWDKNGILTQDTFLDISNDFGEDVRFQMYFINGDAPILP